MKNREKFAKEILDIACKGDVIAVTKDNKVVGCDDIDCEQCLFCKERKEEDDYINYCYCDDTERIRWVESEYVEKPIITSREKNFLDLFLAKWKYLARGEDKNLYVFDSLPTITGHYCYISKNLFGDMFNFIKWEDEKPWSIEDLNKLEVKDE
jgi:hypothetical protein